MRQRHRGEGGLVTLGGMNVAVTGGAGFIGSHLVDRLLHEDPESILVLDDLSSGSEANLAEDSRIRLVVGDIRDPSAVGHVADADVVFHLAVRNVRASLTRPAENFDVNANGTLAVLEAIRAGRRGRFVYVSSSEVYGIPAAAVYREDVVPAPTTAYGAGKLAGEHVTIAYRSTYGMDTRVVRPFNNYGPRSHFEGDSGEVIPKFILRALAGKPILIHGDGTQSRDFMFVRDTADWLVRIATTEALCGETVNIGSGADISVNELARLVLDATGSVVPVEYGPPRPGDLPRLCADTTKLSRFVEFRLPTSFDTGLAETVAYFAQFDPAVLLAAEEERTWS